MADALAESRKGVDWEEWLRRSRRSAAGCGRQGRGFSQKAQKNNNNTRNITHATSAEQLREKIPQRHVGQSGNKWWEGLGFYTACQLMR